jgi:hypothetical protein
LCKGRGSPYWIGQASTIQQKVKIGVEVAEGVERGGRSVVKIGVEVAEGVERGGRSVVKKNSRASWKLDEMRDSQRVCGTVHSTVQ